MSYTDGLFCLTAQYGVPFSIRPFKVPRDANHDRARSLARLALGPRSAFLESDLSFTELDSLASGACASFELWRLAKSSQEATQQDLWATATRALHGFACQVGRRILYPPNLSSADSAVRRDVRWDDAITTQVWDLFAFQHDNYLLVRYASCGGECTNFHVFRIGPDELHAVAKIHLYYR